MGVRAGGSRKWSASGDAVRLEPGQHLLPGLVGGFLAIGGPIVSMKRMGHVRIKYEATGLAVAIAGLQYFLHFRNGSHRYAGVGTRVKTQHRSIQTRSDVERCARHCRRHRIQATVPGHAGFHFFAVARKHPDASPTPTHAGDAHLPGVDLWLLFHKLNNTIKIGKHLRIFEFVGAGQHFTDFAQLGKIAIPEKGIDAYPNIAELGKPPADVFLIIVHPEDLGNHQYGRIFTGLRWRRHVTRHLRPADVHFEIARVKAVGWGANDRLRRNRACGQGEADRGARSQKTATIERDLGQARLQATQGGMLTTQLHKMFKADPLTRMVVPMIDGSRTRESIAEFIGDVALGKLNVHLQEDRAINMVTFQNAKADEILDQLRRSAMLIA